jgi:hypothetical protein
MKKLFSSALLSLVVSGLAAVPSFAGCTFGLFPHSCGCCGCGAKFCVRQYNAFSPVCCGTVFCDGCCPFGSGCGQGMGGCGMGGCGPCGDGMCEGGMCPGGLNFSGVMTCPPGGGCADGACLGSLPAAEPPAMGAPPAANPSVGPSPLPGSMPVGPTSQTVNYRTIENTSYRPAATPATNSTAPMQMRPQMMAAPSYWDN